VERWLIEAEAGMRSTLSTILRASFAAHAAVPRAQWLRSWPGQIVLAVDGLIWAGHTEAAIAGATISAHVQKLTTELLEV
jgi:dynein heavy chain, axonemal